MHLPKAEWSITGLIVERRVLTSKNNPDWSQPIVKVQTMGDTFDVSCAKELYDRIGDGELLQLRGRFDRRPGKEGGSHLNFICEDVTAVSTAGPKAGAA